MNSLSFRLVITSVRPLGQYCTSHLIKVVTKYILPSNCNWLLGVAEKSVAQSQWREAAPQGKIAVRRNLKGNLRRDGVSVCVYAFKSEARKL